MGKLLQSSQMEVICPTARLLLLLAHCPEAVGYFAEQEILLLIVDKVQAAWRVPLVQHDLAQALSIATACCAGSLSQQASDLISGALADAMKEIPRCDAVTYRNLQDAQMSLKSPPLHTSGHGHGCIVALAASQSPVAGLAAAQCGNCGSADTHSTAVLSTS